MKAEEKAQAYADARLELLRPDIAADNYSRSRKMSLDVFDGFEVESAYENGYEQALKDLWHNATDPNDLPEIDREVIALQGLKGGGSRIVFAHRPPASWIGTNILTGEQTVRKPKRYGKGKWNMENVKWWLDVELPKVLNPET